MKIELASIPTPQYQRIEGFVAGAKKMLEHLPNPTGNDPAKIDVDFKESGNCHISLVTGRWVEIDGQAEAVFTEDKPLVLITDNAPDFEQRVQAFLDHANKISEQHWNSHNYQKLGLYPLRKAEYGPSWVKVYSYDRHYDNESKPTEHKQSIFAFICRQDGYTKTLGKLKKGDIHKAASYLAPAKHARGNIFQDNFNNCVGPYGIAYLR